MAGAYTFLSLIHLFQRGCLMALRRLTVVLLAMAFLTNMSFAQQSTTPKHEPALDVTSMDRGADPCVDFFAYSCGGWIRNNHIPPDQSSWDTYSKMQDENLARLRSILDEASRSDANRDAATQKIGDYYSSCMDEKTSEAKAAEPLKPEMERIAKITSKAEIANLAATMIGNNILFHFSSIQDFRDANQMIADADQGGLGLPDRDYYTKEDAKSEDLRKAYLAHVQRMLELLGDKPASAAAEAQTIMRIETSLAKGSMTRVERRDPKALDHKMAAADLEQLSPGFQWAAYFSKVGISSISSLNVSSPNFFKAMNAALEAESLEDWKTYLRWHLVHADASSLSAAFLNENFSFY